jgi:hypothetical protein
MDSLRPTGCIERGKLREEGLHRGCRGRHDRPHGLGRGLGIARQGEDKGSSPPGCPVLALKLVVDRRQGACLVAGDGKRESKSTLDLRIVADP